MSETTYNIERDLKEAQAMAKALIPYVYEDNLYGNVGGGLFGSGKMPSLTIGALLMRLRRLNALRDHMTDAQRATLDEAERLRDKARTEWTMHYNEKMVREAHSRLDAMRTFFEECNESPRQCANIYLPEVLRRTVVQELVGAIADSYADDNDLATKLKGTDSRLRRFTQPSGFVWDAALQPVYPQQPYWWLYARPQEMGK